MGGGGHNTSAHLPHSEFEAAHAHNTARKTPDITLIPEGWGSPVRTENHAAVLAQCRCQSTAGEITGSLGQGQILYSTSEIEVYVVEAWIPKLFRSTTTPNNTTPPPKKGDFQMIDWTYF